MWQGVGGYVVVFSLLCLVCVQLLRVIWAILSNAPPLSLSPRLSLKATDITRWVSEGGSAVRLVVTLLICDCNHNNAFENWCHLSRSLCEIVKVVQQ